jgi:amidohydrolase
MHSQRITPMSANDLDLPQTDIAEATAFRRHLHAMPELSGAEMETARAVVSFLQPAAPDRVVTGLGGHGVAALFDSGRPGPTVLLRAELDALPIPETTDVPHRSRIAGRGHLCGHDGHTATLALLSRVFSRRRPARGRVVLMFQPAEENGSGARAVVADPAFAAFRPDLSFAYHNMPGVPVGHAWIARGVVNCASRGMRITLSGRTAHASQPENGVSPMQALSALMPRLQALGRDTHGPDFRMVTITHAVLGEPAFGIAPGHAEIWATLRTLSDDQMQGLVAEAEALASGEAAQQRLGIHVGYEDVFAHVENAPEAVAILEHALNEAGISYGPGGLPFRASEDFGIFGQTAPGAMVFLGAGEDHPRLHNPDYDFPDEILPTAARILLSAARRVLG